MTCFKSKL